MVTAAGVDDDDAGVRGFGAVHPGARGERPVHRVRGRGCGYKRNGPRLQPYRGRPCRGGLRPPGGDLSGPGRYVEFTLAEPANAVTVHYSISDSADGSGLTAPLGVYVNGSHVTDLTLTSRYAWFYGRNPFSNNPSDGNPHHFYDDVRTMFSSTLPGGSRVRFQVDSGATARTIDTADFEQVAPALTQPAGSLSVTSYGADPTGATESSSAFNAAAAAASSQGTVLWIPPGTYTINQHIQVDNVTIRGAGPWYTVLHGNGVGIYGKYPPTPSRNVKLYDFAIFGEVTNRDDAAQVNAIGGALGGGSVVSNIWMQHTKVGLWLDGPFDGLTVTNCRILDMTADGLNLHNGVSHTTVTHNFVRNTGDDGLALWSEHNADHDNTFSFNTVVLPMLANNIAIYGGHDNAVTDNVVADSLTEGGGLHVANRFNGVPLSGITTLARNTTLRTGSLWLYANDQAMTGTVNVTDTDLLDSSYEAVKWVGASITNVNFSNVRIDGAGTFALQIHAAGSASFTNVTAAHIGASNPIYNCLAPGAFTILQGGGNSGWYTTTPYCGPIPPPVYTYPGTNLALGKSISASSYVTGYPPARVNDGDASSYWESANNAFPQWLQLDLGASTSVSQIVLRLPPTWGTRTQTLSVLGSTGSSFTTLVGSAGYTFNPTAGNAVTITFAATSTRYLRLNFTANTGWPAGQVSELEVYAPAGSTSPTNLALGKSISASSYVVGYPPARANDGDASSYWESASNAFPQWLQLDLGASTTVSRIVLKLPPSTAWSRRTQTLSVLGGTDASNLRTLVGSAGYTFDPTTGNTVSITFTATSTRYLRLSVTANTGWPAGQVSEFQVYAS